LRVAALVAASPDLAQTAIGAPPSEEKIAAIRAGVALACVRPSRERVGSASRQRALGAHPTSGTLASLAA
jgi:hypothetical protein